MYAYQLYANVKHYFKNQYDHPKPLYFWHFWSKDYNFYNKVKVKNIHVVCGAGIGTHNLWKTSRLP